MLLQVCSFIQNFDPYSELRRYDDWWQHDGLHFYRDSLSGPRLLELIRSPRALLEAMPGDDYVCVGIAPPDNSWYLRFYVYLEEENQETFGRFDITLPEAISADFKNSVLQNIEYRMEQTDAGVYYDSICH